MIQRPQATETQFGVNLAIYLFVGLVLGGVATISGAIPGAILFVFVPYYTATWSTNFSFLEGRLVAPADLLYGVLLLAVVFALPGGVIDGIRRVRHARRAHPAEPVVAVERHVGRQGRGH